MARHFQTQPGQPFSVKGTDSPYPVPNLLRSGNRKQGRALPSHCNPDPSRPLQQRMACLTHTPRALFLRGNSRSSRRRRRFGQRLAPSRQQHHRSRRARSEKSTSANQKRTSIDSGSVSRAHSSSATASTVRPSTIKTVAYLTRIRLNSGLAHAPSASRVPTSCRNRRRHNCSSRDEGQVRCALRPERDRVPRPAHRLVTDNARRLHLSPARGGVVSPRI